jgi:predicted aldo/keto reductase-like oxidoreductase
MNEIILGKTGLKVKRIGFGGIPIQRLPMKESDTVLERAIESGINFFDTARVYTDSEEKMGHILSKYRDKIIIATNTYNRVAKGAEQDVDISLKNLKTDYIDLYQLHNISTDADMEKVLGSGGALEGLIRQKEKGKIKHIGVSSHKPWYLEKMLDYFETIQFPFNIIECKANEELIPKAKDKNVGMIAMKPVAGGSIKNVQYNLRYILQSGLHIAIPGMDHPDQVDENFSVLENLKPLSEDEIKKLDAEKELLGDNFCRRCEYCMPCPAGLNISFLHLIRGYYFNYGLKAWSMERLEMLEKGYGDCTACGECITKCPYELDTPNIFRETWVKIQADQKLK